MPNPPPHATLVKFGYPQNLLHEGSHWAVLVRPAQPTLGSLVLCALGSEANYGDLPAEAFVEQRELIARIERTLRQFSRYERINYLMLMMVDPHVHFHILTRYEGDRQFDGVSYPDNGWPGVPDLGAASVATENLIDALRLSWQSANHQEGEI
jgi:diadenosine tetraphosphate (Ap4A) HIT family hydrolase